jgi:hypothetical protein
MTPEELEQYYWNYRKEKGKYLSTGFATATLRRNCEMHVWNQKHPISENTSIHIARRGTKVLIWMLSRFGDAGITDNLVDAVGYDVRVDAEEYLENIELIEKL